MFDEGLDIVVVNYKTPDDLEKFLNSYQFQSSRVPSEVFVMDVNPSEDGQYQIREYLSGCSFQFSYWPIDYNCGYALACNFGALLGDREAIAFFNADTELHDTTLDDCYTRLFSKKSFGVVGPMQVNSSGKITHAGIFGTNKNPKHRGWMSRSPNRFNDVREDAISVSGSAYFIRRETWDDVHRQMQKVHPDVEGAMMPSQLYYEETAVSYVARSLGWKVVYDGSTTMIHEFDQAPKSQRDKKALMNESRRMFRRTMDQLGIERD